MTKLSLDVKTKSMQEDELYVLDFKLFDVNQFVKLEYPNKFLKFYFSFIISFVIGAPIKRLCVKSPNTKLRKKLRF